MITNMPDTENDLDTLKAHGVYSGYYQFFDQIFEIKTNKEEVLADFNKIYSQFQIQDKSVKSEIDSLFLMVNAQENHLHLIFNDTHFKIIYPAHLHLYLYILSFILPRIKSHFLIHAAALSHQNEGTIIAGHSTGGKTTLAIELVKKGFQFLSDELAPLHRLNHRLDPFPRSIGLRDLTLHHLDHLSKTSAHQAPNTKGEVKWMIDINDLRSDALGKTCRAKNVIFLEPQYVHENHTFDENKILEVSFTLLSQSLIEAVKRIDGVTSIEVVADRIYPLLRIITQGETVPLKELEECALCYESGIVSIVYGQTQKPNFQLSPKLSEMTKSDGTLMLAKMLLNAHSGSSLLNEFYANPGQLICALAEITQTLNFYSLQIGKLDLMVKEVEALMRQ